MISKASRKDIIWGYLSQFLNIGTGIILIPIAVSYLSAEDMGLWYLFVAISGFAQLLEFGFQPTISRMTSYVYSGASELKGEGLPEKKHGLNIQLLYDLIFAAKSIYRYVAFGSCIALLGLGSLYLNLFEEFGKTQLISWLLFSLATIINFYYTYYNGLIIGRGDQNNLYRLTAISKIIVLLVSGPLLFFGFGLLSMSIGYFISMITFRFLLYKSYYDKNRQEINLLQNISSVEKDYKKVLWLSSWKLGMTSVGAFMILRGNQFIASSFLGLKVGASYGLSIQLITILSSVSAMIFNLNLPKLNALQSNNDKKSLKELFFESIIYTHLTYIFGAIVIVFFGVYILDIISSNVSLVETKFLILMLLVFQLELNHSMCATYLTTLNRVPFLSSALISGFAIILFGIIVTNSFGYGILGLIVVQFIVQLAYNNWYWPLVAYRDLCSGS